MIGTFVPESKDSRGGSGGINACCFPMFLNRFILILALVGALIAVCLVPKTNANFNNEVTGTYIRVRIAGIVIFSAAIAFLLLQVILLIISLVRSNRAYILISIFSFIDVVMCLAVIGICVPLIQAESVIPEAQFENAVNRRAFLASGILGLISATFYIISLFISRYFQFIARDEDD